MSEGVLPGSAMRFVTARWVTRASPDEGLDRDHVQGVLVLHREGRSLALTDVFDESASIMTLGERRFLSVSAPGGSTTHDMRLVYEIMADGLVLVLARCEGVPVDFTLGGCGIPEHAPLFLSPGEAERQLREMLGVSAAVQP